MEKPDIIPLLVGFTGGQVHLIDPVHKVSTDPYPVRKISIVSIRFVMLV